MEFMDDFLKKKLFEVNLKSLDVIIDFLMFEIKDNLLIDNLIDSWIGVFE